MIFHTASHSGETGKVSRTCLGAALALTLAGLVVAWLAVLTYRVVGTQADQIRLLQAISVGMSREEVVAALGPTPRICPSDRYYPGGEMLMHDFWRRSMTEFYVVLDKNGKVVMVVYPDARRGP